MNEIHRLAWPVVVARIEKELTSLRVKLESPNLDPRATDFTRGEIRALKELLRLPDVLAAEQTSTPPGWPGGEAL